MTDRELLCKEFTELTGGHWHEPDTSRNIYHPYMCSCGKELADFDYLTLHCTDSNPTYENPADVLRVTIDSIPRNIFIRFVDRHGKWWTKTEITEHSETDITYPYFSTQILLEPDALLKAAVEFLKEASHD